MTDELNVQCELLLTTQHTYSTSNGLDFKLGKNYTRISILKNKIKKENGEKRTKVDKLIIKIKLIFLKIEIANLIKKICLKQIHCN